MVTFLEPEHPNAPLRLTECVPLLPTLRSASVWRRPEHPNALLRRDMRAVYFWQGGGLYIDSGGTATLTDCNVYQNTANNVSARDLKLEHPNALLRLTMCVPLPPVASV